MKPHGERIIDAAREIYTCKCSIDSNKDPVECVVDKVPVNYAEPVDIRIGNMRAAVTGKPNRGSRCPSGSTYVDNAYKKLCKGSKSKGFCNENAIGYLADVCTDVLEVTVLN